MKQYCSYDSWLSWRLTIWIALSLCAVTALASCAGRSALPPSEPPAVEVLVPVIKPCEVEQVDPSPLETDDGVPADIYEAAKQVVADLLTLKADREKLAAANDNPCPEIER